MLIQHDSEGFLLLILFFKLLYIYLLCLLCYCGLLMLWLFLKMYYSSKDILMRVVAHNLSPELTLVEKVCFWKIIFIYLCILLIFNLQMLYCSVFTHPRGIWFILWSPNSQGNDPKSWVCNSGDDNPWCIAHNARWEVLASSGFRSWWEFSQNLNFAMWIYHKHPSSGEKDATHWKEMISLVWKWFLIIIFIMQRDWLLLV